MTNETVIESMPPTEVAAIQDECLFKDVEITAAEFDSSHIEADPKQGH